MSTVTIPDIFWQTEGELAAVGHALTEPVHLSTYKQWRSRCTECGDMLAVREDGSIAAAPNRTACYPNERGEERALKKAAAEKENDDKRQAIRDHQNRLVYMAELQGHDMSSWETISSNYFVSSCKVCALEMVHGRDQVTLRERAAENPCFRIPKDTREDGTGVHDTREHDYSESGCGLDLPEVGGHHWVCSRPEGHEGRHIAWGTVVLQTEENSDPPKKKHDELAERNEEEIEWAGKISAACAMMRPSPPHWMCTRKKGHSGDHIATGKWDGTGARGTRYTWPNESETEEVSDTFIPGGVEIWTKRDLEGLGILVSAMTATGHVADEDSDYDSDHDKPKDSTKITVWCSRCNQEGWVEHVGEGWAYAGDALDNECEVEWTVEMSRYANYVQVATVRVTAATEEEAREKAMELDYDGEVEWETNDLDNTFGTTVDSVERA